MAGIEGARPANRRRMHGVRGTVRQMWKHCVTINVEAHDYRGDSARMDRRSSRAVGRVMSAEDDFNDFIRRRDRVIMVLEKISDLPEHKQKGNCKWSVFDVQRDITTTPRPDAFSSPAAYMDMTADQLQVPEGRNRLQTAKLLAFIRQILSVWIEVDLDAFIEHWRRRATGFSEDVNAMRRFVDDYLAGVYGEFSDGKLKLFQGFDEEEIKDEMKRRFSACRGQQPRNRQIIDIIEGVYVVETSEDMESILDRIAASREDIVAVDCEGLNFGDPDRTITLLQLATMDGRVFIFDIKKNPDLLQSGKLKQLLEDPNTIKVIHDCRNDSAALRANFGIKLAGVFDTSVAYSTIMEQCNKIGGPYRIGQKAMCSVLGEDTTFKDDAIFERMTSDKQFWARRPLTADMKNYAAADPACLVPHVYQTLDGMISPLWRVYFDAECEDAVMKVKVQAADQEEF
ncbi:uncharacterized protein [Diadema antillarum]|uniref:uncharacterized protein n=1 Tax=Diadema antillarum TaxID=105358 RepID=UPI003A8761CD